MDVVIGIDQGTTGTRVRAMDRSGAIRGDAYRAHHQHHPQPGWVEHDAEEIWSCVVAAARDVLAQAGGAHPIALGIANQGETVLAFERASGRPLHRALVWQDVRTAEWMEDLASDASLAATVRVRTGLTLDAYFSASKLRWLIDHVPDGRARARAGELCASTLDAWLLHRLTQGRSFATDVSTAARTLLFDIHRRQWDPFLLDLFGVPAHVLPEVRASAGSFGVASAPSIGLADARIAASLVDQPAAMLGQGCLEPGSVKATFGTGCFVYSNAGTEVPESRRGLLATIAWQRDGRVTYALDGGIFAAGSVVTWLREQLALAGSDHEIDALATSVADPGGVVCVPALAGLAAPHWQRRARAAWLGMDLSTTRAHLVRAAFEGIAARVAEVVQAMEADSGLAVPRLRVDGGLSASLPLMQIEADLLGVPVDVAAEPEATVMGVCHLTARAIGWWGDDTEITRRVGTARSFAPRISPAERSARRERFAEAVRVVSAWRS